MAAFFDDSVWPKTDHSFKLYSCCCCMCSRMCSETNRWDTTVHFYASTAAPFFFSLKFQLLEKNEWKRIELIGEWQQTVTQMNFYQTYTNKIYHT